MQPIGFDGDWPGRSTYDGFVQAIKDGLAAKQLDQSVNVIAYGSAIHGQGFVPETADLDMVLVFRRNFLVEEPLHDYVSKVFTDALQQHPLKLQINVMNSGIQENGWINTYEQRYLEQFLDDDLSESVYGEDTRDGFRVEPPVAYNQHALKFNVRKILQNAFLFPGYAPLEETAVRFTKGFEAISSIPRLAAEVCGFNDEFSRFGSLPVFQQEFPCVDMGVITEIRYLKNNPSMLTETYHDVDRMARIISEGRKFTESTVQAMHKNYFSKD